MGLDWFSGKRSMGLSLFLSYKERDRDGTWIVARTMNRTMNRTLYRSIERTTYINKTMNRTTYKTMNSNHLQRYATLIRATDTFTSSLCRTALISTSQYLIIFTISSTSLSSTSTSAHADLHIVLCPVM